MQPINRKRTVQNKLARNAVAGMAATAVYLVSRLLLTPFVLTHLTLAEFGLWSMCFVILSYAAMGAFGVNNTYIRFTAQFHANGNDHQISGLLSTGVFGMLTFCALFGFALFLFMPTILNGFHVNATMAPTASVMILGTAAVFSIDLTLGGFRSVVEGLQEIALVKKIYTGAALVEVGAIILFLSQGTGVRGMLYAYIIRVTLEAGACMLAARHLLPSLSLSPRRIAREHIRHLFFFGGKVQVLGGIAIFLSAFDRMIISAMMGLSAAGMFEVGRKFPFMAQSISAAAFGPFLPAAAGLNGPKEDQEPISWPDRLATHTRIVMLALCVSLPPLAWFPPGPGPGHHPWFPWMVTLVAIGSARFEIKWLKQDFNKRSQVPPGELPRLYLKGIRHINLINMTLFAFLAAVAHPLVTAWVGPGYDDAAQVMTLLSAGYLVKQSTGPVTLIFRGIDRCGLELEYLLIQLIIALIWIPAATLVFGLTGAAGAIAAASVIAAGFLFWRSNHAFQVNFNVFAVYTLAPVLLPMAAAALVYIATILIPCQGRITTALLVIVCGLTYSGLLLPLIWQLVLTQEEKNQAMALTPFSGDKNQPC